MDVISNHKKNIMKPKSTEERMKTEKRFQIRKNKNANRNVLRFQLRKNKSIRGKNTKRVLKRFQPRKNTT